MTPSKPGGYDPHAPTTEPDADEAPRAPLDADGERLQTLLEDAGVRYFHASELLFLPKLDRYAHGRELDGDILRNLVATARCADFLRREVGLPLCVTSGYRPREYNALVNGSAKSQHLMGKAVDLNLIARDRTPEKIELLRKRAVRLWSQRIMGLGGLGLYSSPKYRIHLDIGPHQSWRPEEVDPILAQLREAGAI